MLQHLDLADQGDPMSRPPTAPEPVNSLFFDPVRQVRPSGRPGRPRAFVDARIRIFYGATTEITKEMIGRALVS